jgi:Adenomatosis polyposis coli down-regulated 1
MSPRVLVLFGLLPFATSCTDDAIAKETSALQGRWISADCEDVGGGYFLIRRFTFDKTHWENDGSIYHDAACTAPAFDFYVGGEVDVLDQSKLIAGAYEANFGETAKTLTMRDPAIAGYVNSQPAGTCGSAPWVVDQAQDISATGCQTFGQSSTMACPREYDLVEVMGDALYFGDRMPPNDLCSARPQMLTAAPVVRVM